MSSPRAAMSVATRTVIPAALEPFHGDPALILAAVGMQRRAADAGSGQLARQPVRADLRAHEHQNRTFRTLQVIDQPLHLLRRRDGLHPVRDALRRRAALADLDVLRARA